MSERRKDKMHASEVAAALGFSPFETPHGVWLKKMGLKSYDQEDNPGMLWGRKLEAVVADRYAELNEVELGMGVGLEKGLLVGTPDRLVVGHERILEVKTADSRNRHRWGEAGTDAIPVEYLAQVQIYLGLQGYEEADVALLMGGNDFRVYHVKRDRETEGLILQQVDRWWRDHVVANKPPPITGSEGSREVLHTLFPREKLDLMAASEQASIYAAALQAAKAQIASGELAKATAENLLKEIIGEHQGIEGAGFKITWKETKPITRVNWEHIAKGLLRTIGKDVGEALVSLNTTTTPGIRRFLAKYKEEADAE